MTGAPIYPRKGVSRALLTVALLSAAIAPGQSPSTQNPPASPQQDTSTPQGLRSSATSPAPSFDMVSIHPNTTDRTNRSHIYFSLENSQFRTVNATVMDLIEWAWDLPSSQIFSAPAWLSSTRFDIDAESDSAVDDKFHAMIPAAAKSLKREMVQALLADRFHLVARLETKELPVYALMVQKKGRKFSPVPDGTKKVDATTRSGTVTVTITSSSNAMGDLAEILSPYVGRVVIDKTGITGNYSISVNFASEHARVATLSEAAASESGASVFTALRDQLGLELKPEKDPIEVLSIDHVEMPSKNLPEGSN